MHFLHPFQGVLSVQLVPSHHHDLGHPAMLQLGMTEGYDIRQKIRQGELLTGSPLSPGRPGGPFLPEGPYIYMCMHIQYMP